MSRLLMIIAIAALAALAALWVAPDPGRMVVEWRGVQYETSAAVGFVALVLAAGLLAVVWRLFSFLWNMPSQIRNWRVKANHSRGRSAFATGLLALESGDIDEARRQAERAGDWFDDPRLSLLLRAKAAEADRDWPEAERIYDRLLEANDTRLLARRGMMNAALQRGDEDGALVHAEEALKLKTRLAWPTEAAFGLKVANLDFEGALQIIEKADRKDLVSDEVADRRRGALHAAMAHMAERRNQRAEMRERALEAVKFAPGFAPGASLAAKALILDDKMEKAAEILERAWSVAPHAALAWLYRQIEFSGETERQSSDRIIRLAELNAGHVEAAYIAAEAAVHNGDTAGAERELASVLRQGTTTRACLAMARLAAARGDKPEAEGWLILGLSARHEPDWSNPDLLERAFDFSDGDWSRVIMAYGDHGEFEPPSLALGAPELPNHANASLALLSPAQITHADASLRAAESGSQGMSRPAAVLPSSAPQTATPPHADWAPGEDPYS